MTQPNTNTRSLLNSLLPMNGPVIVLDSHLWVPNHGTRIPYTSSRAWMFFRSMLTPGKQSIQINTVFARLAIGYQNPEVVRSYRQE